MILGLEEPTSGEIWLDGPDGTDSVKENDDRYAPSFNMFHRTQCLHSIHSKQPLNTSRKRIRHWVEDVSDAKSAAETLLSSLGLNERLHALPREMSGGEQRRVTLARVLAQSPIDRCR